MKIHITDLNGNKGELEVVPGPTLMEYLRELDGGIPALCGGDLRCGTCHVYVPDPEHRRLLHELQPSEENERDLIRDLHHKKPDQSRLSCRIRLSPELEGLAFEVAPIED